MAGTGKGGRVTKKTWSLRSKREERPGRLAKPAAPAAEALISAAGDRVGSACR
ncbi:hypothetical protein P4131_27620 [Pseudomonas aeruginosa]|nr:hypothetical protein [Pseudomonas aeruginosa]